MRPLSRAMLACALAFAGCGELAGAVGAGAAPTNTPAPIAQTPLPDVARQLVEKVRLQTATIRRLDRITAVRQKWGDLTASIGAKDVQGDPGEDVWVVVALGEMRSSFGVTAAPLFPCARWAYGAADLLVKAFAGGSLAACAPYFTESLVPPDAPVTCPPGPRGYDYPGGSRTTPGAVALDTSRDDAWRMPSIVPGTFLYEYGDGGLYYETYCRAETIRVVEGPNDAAMLVALGSPKAAAPMGKAQLWLKAYHAIGATAGTDRVVVIVEPRPGFEIASFDWRAVAPRGGYVTFEFRDLRGDAVIPFDVANGP